MPTFCLRLVTRRPIGHAAMTVLLVVAVMTRPIFLPAIGVAQQPSRVPPASSAAALLDQAKKLVQEGDPQGALSILQQADLHGANASDIHAMKGICLALLSKPIESAAELEQAIRLRPGYAPYYLSAGLAYATFDNLDRALERLSI